VRLNLNLGPHQRLRALFFLVVGVGTMALAFGMWGFHFLNQFERQTIDERFAIRGAHEPPPNILEVKIDDVTFEELQHATPSQLAKAHLSQYKQLPSQWPFPRWMEARVLDQIRAGGPKAVAVDIQFTDRENPACSTQACRDAANEDDNALINAVHGFRGRIVLSTTQVAAAVVEVAVRAPDVTTPAVRSALDALHRRALAAGGMAEPVSITFGAKRRIAWVDIRLKGSGSDASTRRAVRALESSVIPATIGKVPGATGRVASIIPPSNGVFGGGDILDQIGAKAGNGNFSEDADGVIRKVSYESQYLQSLSIVAAGIARGRPIVRSEVPNGRAWIDFSGPPQRSVHSVSFSRVLLGDVPPSAFRDKIVVIGATAPVLQDIHDTSTGTGMPGPELQANAIDTALRGFPLRSVPQWLDILLILILGLIAPALGLRFGPIVGTGAALGAAGLFALAAQLSFDHGWIFSFVYPISALAISTVGAIVVHYLVAAVERERVRDLFSRFVPDGVVDQVLARTGGDLRLGGNKQTATVLFSDLRGFTASAEEMDAADVIRVLNYYLGEMTDAILAHGGTLVSYIGDGIYAVFGAPIELEDHADRAVSAALEMVEVRLARFNAWTREAGFGEGYQMGVGLNTGPIMSGNVGHERRLEYTAVGDTVNTASRIEGMTKGTGYSIFVSETTYAALQRAPGDLTYYDEVEIRGRRNRIKLWGTSPKVEVGKTPPPAPAPEPVDAPVQVEPV
jgi:adenylate cyclase